MHGNMNIKSGIQVQKEKYHRRGFCFLYLYSTRWWSICMAETCSGK